MESISTLRSSTHSDESRSQRWRSIDLGHHSLRWLDRQHTTPVSNTSFQVDSVKSTDASQTLTLDRLALCELESINQNSLSIDLGRSTPFKKWMSLDHLTSSPFLGALSLIDKRDNQLWVNTQEGEYTPKTIFSKWLNESLSPSITIGEARSPANHSLIWLTSPSRLPTISSMVYRCLSELPYTNGASINSAIATLIGIEKRQKEDLKRGIWGVLDIGEGQGTWSLIEVSQSYIPGHSRFRTLKSYGRSLIGERGLRRALLNQHFADVGRSWTELNHSARREWLEFVSLQADTLIRRSWPRFLRELDPSLSSANVQISAETLDLFTRYHRGTYEAFMDWIHHSLESCHIGPEALRGIYVTGKYGLGISGLLRKGLSAVNIRLAPSHIELEGAQAYVENTLYEKENGYHIEEVSSFALILLDEYEQLSKVIFPEQTALPGVFEIEVGPTQGKISLWLSSYGDSEERIAEYPPLSKSRLLRVYYEGPHLFELTWADRGDVPVDDKNQPIDQGKWTYA